ncbi:MAG: hypothetical protein AAF458_05210 [Pseudomonadota bacterium]
MQNRYFEYCRFKVPPRELLTNPVGVRNRFRARAESSGGTMFGCWRSLGGLGMSRDEGIALSAWPSEDAARGAPDLVGSEQHFLEASVRPVTDDPVGYTGTYVFRWFDLKAQNWETFRDLSDEAWPTMERVFDANICGFWRSLDVEAPECAVLLLTRYADLSQWEASRWWHKPQTDADAAMSRFDARNDLTEGSVAYPAQAIFAGGPE